MLIEYQKSWSWIRENKNAPFTTVVYVGAVTVIVQLKNIFSDKTYEVLVEAYRPDDKTPFATLFLPRICIMEHQGFKREVTNLIETALRHT